MRRRRQPARRKDPAPISYPSTGPERYLVLASGADGVWSVLAEGRTALEAISVSDALPGTHVATESSLPRNRLILGR